jgi:hypothetical protein
MSTELVQVLQESQLPDEKKEVVKNLLDPFFAKAREWQKQVETIVVTDPTQTDKMALAKTGRLQLKNMRLDAKDLVTLQRQSIKARMADDVLEDKLWLHSGQIMEAVFKNLETKLEEKEKFAERYQAELEEKLRAERTQILAEYGQPEIPGLGKMLQDQFDMYIAGVKAKFEADKKAEEERIEAQRIQDLQNERYSILCRYEDFIPNLNELDLGRMTKDDFIAIGTKAKADKDAHDKEQARIKAENERLQKEKDEADERARQAEAKALEEKEKAEAEARAEQKRIQDEADAKAEKIRKENEAKLQAEQAEKQKAIDEANRLKEAEQKRIQDEQARKDAELAEQKRIASQGETERLLQWVESFELPQKPTGEYSEANKRKIADIRGKHSNFRVWAKDILVNK